MKIIETSQNKNDGLTQEDIDKATERLQSFFQRLTETSEKEKSSSRTIKDDGKHLTFQSKPDPNSPIDQIRKGKPLKIKTIFHAVEVEIKDQFGGVFTCEYHIRETIKSITNGLGKSYPTYSKADIEKTANLIGKDYEETKTELADNIAQRIFDMRLAVAKFFHDQLEPTLKTVLDDLITDAELKGLEKYGYQLARASDYEKVQKNYLQLRKKRVEIIKGKGRPKGSLIIDEAEFNQIIEKINGFIREIKNKNQNITKHAVAKKLYPQNSNPLQQINRFLKRYEITFQQIIDEFHS
jgi:hypothetical protein